MIPASAVFTLLALNAVLCAQTAPTARNIRVALAVVSQSEDGPPIGNGAGFQPGDVAFFSFHVENYKIGPTGKIQLTAHIEVLDPKGTPIIPKDEQAIGTSV